MKLTHYFELKNAVRDAGYGHEIEWAQNIKVCSDSLLFRDEYCWVVINSGMKEQVARRIWERVRDAKLSGLSASTAFRHIAKCKAIDDMWDYYNLRWRTWAAKNTNERLVYLRTIPFIGPITVWHFAKNLGMDVAKPDRHLVRIAAEEGVDSMCARLSEQSGDRIALVDTVIWRAANLGLV